MTPNISANCQRWAGSGHHNAMMIHIVYSLFNIIIIGRSFNHKCANHLTNIFIDRIDVDMITNFKVQAFIVQFQSRNDGPPPLNKPPPGQARSVGIRWGYTLGAAVLTKFGWVAIVKSLRVDGFKISWSNIELLVVSDFFFPLALLEQALDSKVQCFFSMKKMPQRQMSKFSFLYINLLELQFCAMSIFEPWPFALHAK